MRTQEINEKMVLIHNLVEEPKKSQKISLPVACGIDLGTASIVFIVIDSTGKPIFSASQEADVVRDGLVVNYSQAVQIVRKLRQKAEDYLGITLTTAAGAIPPGTIGNNRNAVGHVIESAEMEASIIVDEPEAAALALGVTEGAVVDVGGGTTGISIFKNGKVVFSADEATGGTQMTLVLAGAKSISIAEGEKLKRNKKAEQDNFEIIRPVVEKMAAITKNFIEQYGGSISTLYLVGGATKFSGFRPAFEKYLGIPVIQTVYPEFVTPLGIALADGRCRQ